MHRGAVVSLARALGFSSQGFFWGAGIGETGAYSSLCWPPFKRKQHSSLVLLLQRCVVIVFVTILCNFKLTEKLEQGAPISLYVPFAQMHQCLHW